MILIWGSGEPPFPSRRRLADFSDLAGSGNSSEPVRNMNSNQKPELKRGKTGPELSDYHSKFVSLIKLDLHKESTQEKEL